jgi:ParB-like chromosome segregation protein Spo0J
LEIKNIPIELLLEHPENCNFMNIETAKKLRRHIEGTGRYEPLTVRPHPNEKSRFQVINGHNRLHVLRVLDYKVVYCVVWNIDDVQTRLYLATLNRLSGNDVPERRAMLLEILAVSFDAHELALLLPDSTKQLEELKRLSRIDIGELPKATTFEEIVNIPVILSFMVNETEASDINLALDSLLDLNKAISRSQALVQLARSYLG